MLPETKPRYFRNIPEFFINEPIDPESLWQLKDHLLVLVDDDQYITIDYENNKKKFREVFDQD